MRLNLDSICNVESIIEKRQISLGKITKVFSDTFIPQIPNEVLMYSYTLPHLKLIAKTLGLKVSGNKTELTHRIFQYLYVLKATLVLQRVFKKYLFRLLVSSHGPASQNRSLCTNISDFFTMEPLEEIPLCNFFSFKDKTEVIYGFDIMSFTKLIQNSSETNQVVKNPYTRNIIDINVLTCFRRLMRLSIKYGIPIDLQVVEEEITEAKKLELRVIKLFQTIDELGNYSNPNWFMSLNIPDMVALLSYLIDVWQYRAGLTLETKYAICPPNGNPFSQLPNLRTLLNSNHLENVRNITLKTLENFIYPGIDRDSKYLGTVYVLGSLTLVNIEARNTLPWLYESFANNL
jgi:SAP domain-containing new25